MMHLPLEGGARHVPAFRSAGIDEPNALRLITIGAAVAGLVIDDQRESDQAVGVFDVVAQSERRG
jgi:hypothetical protein